MEDSNYESTGYDEENDRYLKVGNSLGPPPKLLGSDWGGGDIIDSSIIEDQSFTKPKIVKKSILYDPSLGSYVGKDVVMDEDPIIRQNSDVSNRANSTNYGTNKYKPHDPRELSQPAYLNSQEPHTYEKKIRPPQIDDGWKTIASAPSVRGQNRQENLSSDKCPICRENAVMTCNCSKRDSVCKNRHEWHTTERGNVVLGSSHKLQSARTNDDTCVVS
jgi:hypothetical protein